MGKKQTNRYDNAIMFLKSVIERHNIERKSIDAKIAVYSKLAEILKRKSVGEKIPNSDYEELKKLDCPSKSFLLIFGGDFKMEDNGFYMPDEDFLYFDCPNMNCIECWRHFVSDLCESINSSELTIKMPSEDDGGRE